MTVQPPLLSLLAGLEGVVQIFAKGTELPSFDFHCPLLSLPLAFKTEFDTIPSGVPYIQSDAALAVAWKQRLGEQTKPRIGLAWSGNPEHKNDHNRSLTLAQLLPLLNDKIDFISLQLEVRENDAALLASHTEIRHYGNQLKDFSDTAALIQSMDLVISVDSSVAHLAGAMGKAVWILLPFNSDWRWLLCREDTPWYPTARLFRQPVSGDWKSVIDRLHHELELNLVPYGNGTA